MRFAVTLALLAAVAAGTSSADPASATSACGKPGYSYAGLQAVRPAHGVRAEIVALGSPHVQSGHVAAWVGVGGPGQGQGGRDAWIQVGLSAFQGEGSRLYLEVNRPGIGPRYTQLRSFVPPGARFRVAVRETRGRPGWWSAWVNGRRVSQEVYLPGSSGRWRPIATAETWDGGRRVCNLFAYRFDRLVVVAPGRVWRRFDRGYRFQDPGYRVLSSRSGFVARASRPLPRTAAPAGRKADAPAEEGAGPAPGPAPEAHAAGVSADDADRGPGPDVPLEDQDGVVVDADAAVGDGLP